MFSAEFRCRPIKNKNCKLNLVQCYIFSITKLRFEWTISEPIFRDSSFLTSLCFAHDPRTMRERLANSMYVISPQLVQEFEARGMFYYWKPFFSLSIILIVFEMQVLKMKWKRICRNESTITFSLSWLSLSFRKKTIALSILFHYSHVSSLSIPSSHSFTFSLFGWKCPWLWYRFLRPSCQTIFYVRKQKLCRIKKILLIWIRKCKIRWK